MVIKDPPKGKEWLYVGHYTDVYGRYILKIGTTNDLKRRVNEHTREYRAAKTYTLPAKGKFFYDWCIALSKYNTIRYEDKNRQAWREQGVGKFVRNDRFNCGKHKPETVTITIRKTYVVTLGGE